MSACGFAARAPLRAYGPRVLRWKTLRVSSAPHPCGFESHAPGTKKKGLHYWRPNNSMVGDEGCPRAASPPAPRFGPTALACCAGKRFAFPQLRTLAGSNPMHRAQKRKASITGGLTIQWWAMRDVRVRLRRPRPASGLRPSRAALENASRFLSSAPLRVRIPCTGHKKERPPLLEA